MRELQATVRAARRRLAWEQLVRAGSWSFVVGSGITAVALAVPKFWELPVSPERWYVVCLGVGLLIGIVGTMLVGIPRIPSQSAAALEVDRRGGLKERLSSAIALDGILGDPPMRPFLREDALRRTQELDLANLFPIRWPRPPVVLLPLILAGGWLIGLAPNASPKPILASTSEEDQRVQRAAKELRHKIEQRAKQSEDLPDAQRLFRRLEQEVVRLHRSDAPDRRKTLVTLNRLADEVRRRRQELGSTSQLKDRFRQLKNLAAGPADRMLQSMRRGDFGQAAGLAEKLAQRWNNQELSASEKRQIARQFREAADRMAAEAAQNAQRRADLQREVARLRQSGDTAGANRLSDELKQQEAEANAPGSPGETARALTACSKALQSSDSAAAGKALESLHDSLDSLDRADRELRALDDALQNLADCKSGLGCPSCNGEGCGECQGMTGFEGASGRGRGAGQGQGQGSRPEAKGATQFYDSRVAAEIRRGRAVVTGTAGGPNTPGEALLDIQSAWEAARSADADPIDETAIPRGHRAHVRQYFDALRGATDD